MGHRSLRFDGSRLDRVRQGPAQTTDQILASASAQGHIHTLSGHSTETDGGEQHPFDVQGLERHVAEPQGAPGLLVACGRLQAVYATGLGLFDLLHDAVVLDFSDSPAVAACFETMLVESHKGRAGTGAW